MEYPYGACGFCGWRLDSKGGRCLPCSNKAAAREEIMGAQEKVHTEALAEVTHAQGAHIESQTERITELERALHDLIDHADSFSLYWINKKSGIGVMHKYLLVSMRKGKAMLAKGK